VERLGTEGRRIANLGPACNCAPSSWPENATRHAGPTAAAPAAQPANSWGNRCPAGQKAESGRALHRRVKHLDGEVAADAAIEEPAALRLARLGEVDGTSGLRCHLRVFLSEAAEISSCLRVHRGDADARPSFTIRAKIRERPLRGRLRFAPRSRLGLFGEFAGAFGRIKSHDW
jgi:hypothetical protein